MRHEIFFQNVNAVGDLFLDYVFFEFESEPLLFACIDRKNHLYFCHCYKLLSEQKWFAVPVSIDRLLALVDGIVDIREMILASKMLLDITRDVAGNEASTWRKGIDVPLGDLPPFGTRLRCNREEARQYYQIRRKTPSFSYGNIRRHSFSSRSTTQ